MTLTINPEEGKRKLLQRVNVYDDFLAEMINIGLILPREYYKHPSDLRREQLEKMIDEEFKPLAFRHTLLLQLLGCREEEYLMREKVSDPKEIPSFEVIKHWNEEDARDFKKWYLDKYFFKYFEELDKEQINYASKLCKEIGIYLDKAA